jgi:citrate/tricarballylate utilization protein
MLMDDLFEEARRQLTVCNACRYCEGYCPVWPSLELRVDMSPQDLTHLSNLCHDCRDCFSACMYTAPHEFALNPPQVFAAVRTRTYEQYAWPRQWPAGLRGWRGRSLLAAVAAAVVVALALLLRGVGTAERRTGSPYRLLPHWVLVGLVLLPVVWGAGVAVNAARAYWRDVHGSGGGLLRPRVWASTLVDGIRLRHMRGGGEECDYPADEPTALRRRAHGVLVGGLALCFVSTVSAWFEQQFFGLLPPYPLVSAPVLTGTVGGLLMLAGAGILLGLKRRADPGLSVPRMVRADNALLVSLALLSLTGLLTLVLRETPVFLPVLTVHLVTILACFAIAPYGKVMHPLYRLLSIYQFRSEQGTP